MNPEGQAFKYSDFPGLAAAVRDRYTEPLRVEFECGSLATDVVEDIRAIGHLTAILEVLDPDCQRRVLAYLNDKYHPTR